MRFVTGCVCLLLTIATVQAFVGCGSSKFPSGELVMFTAFGPHAFEGRVVVARPEVRTESAREVAILSLDFVRPVGYSQLFWELTNVSFWTVCYPEVEIPELVPSE